MKLFRPLLGLLRKFYANTKVHPYEASIAFAVALAAIYYLLAPAGRQVNVVSRTLPSMELAWNVIYAVAGVFTLLGLGLRLLFVEAVGQIAMASAFALQGVATALVFSPISFSGRLVVLALFVALVNAALHRLFTLIWRGRL